MKRFALIAIFIMACGLFGCSIPAAPPYPYIPFAELDAHAQQVSDSLEAYIKDWKAGKVPAEMPRSVLVEEFYTRPCYNTRPVVLKDPDTLTPMQKMGTRPAHIIDFAATKCLFPDPHCTYMIPCSSYGPFGAKAILKGKFPYARFLNFQTTPPFDSRFYNWLGVGDPTIVDADIIPDSGSINPFLPGANRKATNRNYTVTFEYKKGRITEICGATHQPPYYRHNSNHRFSSGIHYMGPWHDPNYVGSDGKKSPLLCEGPWKTGLQWIRYYAPDGWGKTGFDPFAGVGVPDFYMQLASGEKYICWTDPREFEKSICKTKPAIVSTSFGDPGSTQDINMGWIKQFGIFHQILSGMYLSMGQTQPIDKKEIRDYVLGATGCGESQPAPGNWEPSESCVTQINYMTRGMTINTGKVAIICGQLPTYPKTLAGNATMEGAKQIRYFSICSYDSNIESDGMLNAGCMTSIMDEEIVTDAYKKYVIVYSRLADKPTNATSAAGVTWVNWGPTVPQSWTIRWMGVYPDWYMTDKTPNEQNATWSKTTWSGCAYDPNILSANHRNGLLKEFQPVVYYLTKASFQAIGTPVTEAKVKSKQSSVGWGCGSGIITDSDTRLLVLLPLMLLVFANGIWFFRRKN